MPLKCSVGWLLNQPLLTYCGRQQEFDCRTSWPWPLRSNHSLTAPLPASTMSVAAATYHAVGESDEGLQAPPVQTPLTQWSFEVL